MLVAGVMSGTSADGINVAFVKVSGMPDALRWKLVAHDSFSYPKTVRAFILRNMNAQKASVAELSRLNFLLGELYADAVARAGSKSRIVKIDLVGCHGQTLFHQGARASFLGRKIACTWQTGEGAVLAARLGVPVVSDFRPADMAAGGKGAPLVPMLDYLVYRDARRGRILQNIGGIANLTAIPASASLKDVTAFDTGPGNMVIDACMERLYGKPFDRSGKIAATGRVNERAVREILKSGFFRQRPPKTAGREEFGREFVAAFLRRMKGTSRQDVIATATMLTARSIALAVSQ